MEILKIKDLKAEVNGKKILNGVNMTVKENDIHILMGPNGGGKSSIANIIMGNPKYKVTEGTIEYANQSILNLKVDERAKKGIFLAFQEPVEIPGVNVMNFLTTVYINLKGKNPNLRKEIIEKMKELNLPESFLKRSLNEGFSGGEKKRFELLQVMLLKPKLAILDEIDSGMDIDSVKFLGVVIKSLLNTTSFIMITHNDHILDYIKPNSVSIIKEGKILKNGDYKLIEEIKQKGYNGVI